MAKMTKQQMDYYEAGTDGVVFSEEDSNRVDEERMMRIEIMAQNDVSDRKEKRSASSFKNDSEYRYYQLCVYESALREYEGID